MEEEELKPEASPSFSFLDSVEGEIAFFSALMRARPVGIHRHFHVLTMRNEIHKLTGRLLSVGEIWEKLKTCYDLDLLEAIVSLFTRTRCVVLINVSRKSMATMRQGRCIRPIHTHLRPHRPRRT